ncbi:hypothetical protein LY78DRAFT_682048 [Colletotrichum sublineola]|nr:hypothetical protein LY78DRAFT_682048 [Colletotrichum sublineola]
MYLGTSMGSTPNAFNAWFIDEWYDTPTFTNRALSSGPPTSNGIIPPEDDRRSLGPVPNNFAYYNQAMHGIDELFLFGSLEGAMNPIRLLIVPKHQVGFTIVYKVSLDAEYNYNWVNGKNFVNTAQSAAQGNIFSWIPEVATLVTHKLAKQPTFSGCDTSSVTGNAFNLATYGNGTVDSSWPACSACITIRAV